MNTRDLAVGTIIAALYAIAVIVLAPISFFLFQVRVADALIPLSLLFGMPAVWGVTLGAVVANVYGGLGAVDILGGALANFVAAYVGWRLGARPFAGAQFLATVAQTLIVSSIVGFYLAALFEVPLEAGFVGVLLGSIIAINIVGYLLVVAIQRSGLQPKP